MIRYIPPRKAELDKEGKGSVFDDKRTKRKRADKYTGVQGKKIKPFSKMPVIKQRIILMGTKT